ncbi:MAG: hypothetical protein WAV76_09895 [Bacteroidota bacterium]
MNLTQEELDFLLDCVDCREADERRQNPMAFMLDAMICRGDENLMKRKVLTYLAHHESKKL